MARQHRKKNSPTPKGMPNDAVVADPLKQVPNGSYDPPPLWYVDKEFRCVDCGNEETWTASSTKMVLRGGKRNTLRNRETMP